jgi:hypothetical protein
MISRILQLHRGEQGRWLIAAGNGALAQPRAALEHDEARAAVLEHSPQRAIEFGDHVLPPKEAPMPGTL